MNRKAIAIEFIAYSFIILFAYTAISKWIIFPEFVKQMDAQPFDDFWTPLLVWGLPALELVIAAMLLFNRTKLLGLILATLLMISFTIYIKLVLSNHYGFIPCACGGIIRKLNWWQHLWFNVYFVIIGILGVLLMFSRKRTVNSDLKIDLQNA